MRTIKFIVWDKKLNRMTDVEKIIWDVGEIQNNKAQWIPISIWVHPDYSECDKEKMTTQEYDACANADYFILKDFILMQFTGLLDKNGKEIYEGDILDYWFHDLQGGLEKGKGVVVWGMTGWKLHVDYELPNIDGGELIEFWDDNELWTLEIIGNIYENPELIKEN